MEALFRAPAKRYVAPNFAVAFAEIDVVILRKEEDVAQFGHATGEPRHIGCKWMSIWKLDILIFPVREI